jgi:hypothetical protein
MHLDIALSNREYSVYIGRHIVRFPVERKFMQMLSRILRETQTDLAEEIIHKLIE